MLLGGSGRGRNVRLTHGVVGPMGEAQHRLSLCLLDVGGFEAWGKSSLRCMLRRVALVDFGRELPRGTV